MEWLSSWEVPLSCCCVVKNHLHPAGQRMLSWPNMLLSPVLYTCDISNVTSLLLCALCEAPQCSCWAEGRWAALKLCKSPLPNILFPSMNCHCGFQICPKLSPVTQVPDILLFPTFPVWVSGVLLNVWSYWKDGNHHTPLNNAQLNPSKPLPSHKQLLRVATLLIECPSPQTSAVHLTPVKITGAHVAKHTPLCWRDNLKVP